MSTADVVLGEPGPAAVYERDLPVSLERIWENVLDWEHLPYLHSQAFTTIDVESSDADGWSATIGLPGSPARTARIDVRLDRPNLRYVTRTLSGSGAGTEIVTHLTAHEDRRTGIRVEFLLPWAPEDARASIGELYRAVYVELWDQDEAMMVERQRVLDALDRPRDEAASISLGRVRELARRLPLDVELGGRRFRVVSTDGRIVAYDTRCPHLGGPIGAASGCELVCPWHGYRFDLRTGQSSDGRGLRMGRSAVVEVHSTRGSDEPRDACEGEVTLRLP